MKIFLMVMLTGFLSAPGFAAQDHSKHEMAHQDDKEKAEAAVHHGWIRLMPTIAKSSAAYFVLHNFSDKDITLISVSSPVAKYISIHNTVTENGTSTMESITELLIPANEKVIFNPGAKHLMLTGLTTPLKKQQKVSMTFKFDSGKELQTTLTVTADGQSYEMKDHDKHQQQHH